MVRHKERQASLSSKPVYLPFIHTPILGWQEKQLNFFIISSVWSNMINSACTKTRTYALAMSLWTYEHTALVLCASNSAICHCASTANPVITPLVNSDVSSVYHDQLVARTQTLNQQTTKVCLKQSVLKGCFSTKLAWTVPASKLHSSLLDF